MFRFFGPRVCRILASQSGIEPASPALKSGSLNHWTIREAPKYLFLIFFKMSKETLYDLNCVALVNAKGKSI